MYFIFKIKTRVSCLNQLFWPWLHSFSAWL